MQAIAATVSVCDIESKGNRQTNATYCSPPGYNAQDTVYYMYDIVYSVFTLNSVKL